MIDQTAIFGPMLGMVLLTFVVWVFLFVRRVGFIQGQGITPEQLSVPGALASLTPAEVSNPSDNFKNLFEVPVLFYVLVGYLFATQQVDAPYVTMAWLFFVFRTLHSAVHCTFNWVMLRFYLYAASTALVWIIAGRAGLHYLAG